MVSSTGTWVIQPVPPTDEWNAGGYFDCPGLPWESCSPGWEGVEITVSKASGDQSSDKAIESESSTDPVAPMTLPGTPVDITIESEGSGALISWSPPISNGGSQITGYTITSSVGDISVTTEETSILIEGLNDEIEYTFLVTANNSIGAGEQSGISGKFSLPEAAEPTVSTSTVPVVTSTETQPTSVNTVPEPTDNAVPRTSDPRPSSLVGRAVGDTGDSSSNMPLILIGIVIGSIVVIALGLQGYRRIRSS